MGELVFGQFCSGGTKSRGAKTFLFRWEISFAASARPVNINPIYVLPIGSREGVAKKLFLSHSPKGEGGEQSYVLARKMLNICKWFISVKFCKFGLFQAIQLDFINKS